MIVEDETLVRVMAESVLQEAGHQTLSAATLAEAQALFHSDEQFDLIFTDVTLANYSEGGIAVGRLATQYRPGMPILYTSGRELTDDMKAERSAFLPKPYTAQDLKQAVAEILD
jgi:CheY-like chemotaxis protein